MSIPGLGPKKAMVLYQELGVASVPELVAAIEDERVAGLKGFGGKTQENILRGLQQLSDSGGRVLVNAALDVAESLLAELDGHEAGPPGGVRRIAAADARDDRRRRPAGRERQRRADHGRVRRAALGVAGDRARRHEVVDPDRPRAAGRPPRRPQGGLGRRDDLLHRIEGAQRPDPRDGGPRRSEAQRVRAVRREDGRAPRRGDRGAGLRASRVAVLRADAPRGSRRGRGRARRRAAQGPAAQGPPRRPAHPHEPDGRARAAGGDVGHGRRRSATRTTP